MRTQERTKPTFSAAPQTDGSPSVDGAAGAAILASGIGCFVVGLMATLSEASEALSNVLKFVAPVGPLSGKTTIAVAVWLLAWGALHLTWRGKEIRFTPVIAGTLALIALGILGTFPPFFEIFAAD